MKSKISLILLALLLGTGLGAAVNPADAQSVKSNAIDRTKWYKHPREIHIIDDRPVVRDFREAPVMPSQIQLPPGPQGYGGPGSGNNGGLGGDTGSPLPSGGMPIGGGNGDPGYRSDPESFSAVPLEKSGFGRHTNIPARGMAPKTALPGGFSTGIHGKVLPWAKAAPAGAGMGAGASRQMSNAQLSGKMLSPAKYSSNYDAPTGSGSSMGSGGSWTDVHGFLLKRGNR